MQANEYGGYGLPARFWQKAIPEPNSGCWLWMGATAPTGYGNYWTGDKFIAPHRLMCIVAHGMPFGGYEACHSCDTRACCNPDHLRWGTRSENMQDMRMRGRSKCGLYNKVKTHCVNGHEFSDANTWTDRRGRRTCRPCHAAHQRRYRSGSLCK